MLRTDQSFTVSAWANPEDLGDGAHSIVSQDGPTRTPFALSYRPRVVNGVQGDYWTFSMLPPSGDGADSVQSKAPLSYDDASRWTHLVAVYDATRKEVRLYVNGELQNRTHNWMPVWQRPDPSPSVRPCSTGCVPTAGTAASTTYTSTRRDDRRPRDRPVRQRSAGLTT